MVRIRVDESHLPHPDMAIPLRFVMGCIKGDASIVEISNAAIENCRRLQQELPHEPSVSHVSGVISFIHTNPEAAKASFGEALLAQSDYRFAAEALSDLLALDPAWDGTADFLAVLAKGRPALLAHYGKEMHRAVNAGRMDEADHFAQRISAINNPFIAKLQDIVTCRRETAAMDDGRGPEAAFERVYAKYQAYWDHLEEADVIASSARYAEISDRRQFAEIVVDLIEGAEPRQMNVVELGCFGGFNLQNIHDRLPERYRANIDFIGIEPSDAACRAGQAISPAVRFVEGGHTELLAGDLGVPPQFDICLISRVLMILRPAEVTAIVNHLGGRAASLVICDDIANFKGAGPVIRIPPDFIVIHPFERLLADAGFRVSALIPADVPDRECTGFIVAEREPG